MTLKYKVVQQATPGKKGGGTYKYYARACNRTKRDLKYLASILSKRSSLSPGDIVSVLTELTILVPELLMENNTVQLGDLGTISLHLKSEGHQNEKDVTWRSIQETKVQFRAGIEFKRAIQDLHFERQK